MHDIDFTLCDIPMLISRNKNTTYKQQVVSRHTALMQFLTSHGLINKPAFDDDGRLKMDLVLKQSEVSPMCVALYRKAIPAWHNYLDKGGDLNNISKLEKALAQLSQAPQP